MCARIYTLCGFWRVEEEMLNTECDKETAGGRGGGPRFFQREKPAVSLTRLWL